MGSNLIKIDRVSKLLSEVQYLYGGTTDPDTINYLAEKHYCLETSSCKTVLEAVELGMDSQNIYYDISSGATPGEVEACFGKCRYMAGSLDEIKLIDEITARHTSPTQPQPIEIIGIHIVPEDYKPDNHPAFYVHQLAGLAAEFRRLKHISIRGCFVRANLASESNHMLHGVKLGEFFRACYETAKRITVTLPCGMAFVNMTGVIEALWQNTNYHPETLQGCLQAAEIVKHQNETAFYARLLLS